MTQFNDSLPARPARSGKYDRETPFNKVIIYKLPANATERDVRKAIGPRLHQMQREPRIHFRIELPRTGSQSVGYLIFTDSQHAKAWMDKYGNRNALSPIEIGGVRLLFASSHDRVDQYQIQAILDNAADEENDSDYDEEEDDKDQKSTIQISRLECGAFDDAGRYCVGWSKDATSAFSVASFDIDEARLRIRCEDNVVQSTRYEIRYVYASDRNLYIEFKNPPMFLVDETGKDRAADSLAWLDSAPPNFTKFHEQYRRVSAFDEKHGQCVQYGTMYRMQMIQPKMLFSFLKGTKGRLVMQARIKEQADADASAFDSAAVDRLLPQLPFVVAFQAQALLGPNKLLPGDLANLRSEISSLNNRLGAEEAAAVLSSLRSDLLPRGPLAKHEGWKMFTMKQIKDRLVEAATNPTAIKKVSTQNGKLMMIHSIYITPCYGVKLEGPHADEGNRILRQYPGKDENFIRVHISEEDGSAFRVVLDYGSIDSEVMMHDRFGEALRKGLVVGGRRFQFLAFSGSSLREHSCWFVRSFKWGEDNKKITASSIRESIGELHHIRSPARYAARMGQAFTSTSTSIVVKADHVKQVEDIKSKCGKYEFSDGVGTMSKKVCDRINRAVFRDTSDMPAIPPSTFQIRMGGAKGMLSLDTQLEGEQVILRKSMVKFASNAGMNEIPLEIAHYYTKPVPMFLNRPMVALLESLGVEADAFVQLQEDAVQALEKATFAHDSAIALLHRSGVGRGCNFEGIIRSLNSIGINAITQVPFLHSANISLVNFALRNIKYRARIKVPHCHTLVGVMDEYNVLAENQVVACINENGVIKYLKGRCLLGRSPMLAPGDVQYAHAVEPKKGHPLREITNAVIFSQKGDRPMASMLSGGDLDGDLFNIIQHPDLMPEFTCDAADYEKTSMLELPRQCTVDDVVDFFLDYMKLDKLGLIATRHLEVSDRSVEGMLDPDCIILAAMHSIAVDFPKSGSLPEIKRMPRAPRQKPDYRKTEYRTEDRRSNSNKLHPRCKDLYYPSQKALGLMFRGIDVYNQTKEWEEKSRETNNDWKNHLWEVLLKDGRGGKWKGLIKQQTILVEEYYSRMWVLAQEHCSEEKGAMLDEEEVFMGHIICRGPNGTRLSRFDATNRLQDDFKIVCEDIRKRVLFDPILLEDMSKLKSSSVWHWVMTNAGQRVTEHDVIKAQIQWGEELNDVAKQLRRVLERGVAYVKAAFEYTDKSEKPKEGRSAPWIIVPALLATHTCLDVLESLLKRGDQESGEEGRGDSGEYEERSRVESSPESSSRDSLAKSSYEDAKDWSTGESTPEDYGIEEKSRKK